MRFIAMLISLLWKIIMFGIVVIIMLSIDWFLRSVIGLGETLSIIIAVVLAVLGTGVGLFYLGNLIGDWRNRRRISRY